jgi:hypothetical protein
MEEVQLGVAVKIAYEIQRRIDESEGVSETPIVEVAWTPYTLALSIGGYCVWEDQVNSDDDLTFKFCWGQFVEWRNNLANIK